MKQAPFFLILTTIFLPFACFAASGGHHGQEHSIGELWYHFINFSLYIILLYLLLKNPVSGAWQKRRESISTSLAKGTSILSEARSELKEAEKRAASVGADSETIRKQMIKETEDEVSMIIQDAEKRAKEIVRRGEESAAAEKKLVERVIREELSRSVISRAKELLANKISKDSDKVRREASLKNISQIIQ